MSLAGTFYFFGIVAFLAVIFGIFILPETRGKTLDEINKMFYTNNIINIHIIKNFKNKTNIFNIKQKNKTKYTQCMQEEKKENNNFDQA